MNTKLNRITNVKVGTSAQLLPNTCYKQPFSEVFNEDCIQVMKRYPDKFFDLAVVDPPYGIGANKMQLGNATKKVYRGENDWDNSIPTAEYWEQLFRVSKNQIVWGGNYYQLPPSKCWLVWDKNNGESDFADGEMAWTSFDKPMRIKKIHWCGSASKWEDTKGKIHPTQKPVKLYDWIFSEFSKEGDLVLDTHLGSASSRISANKAKLRFIGCEIDTKYFNDGEARFKEFVSQLRLF